MLKDHKGGHGTESAALALGWLGDPRAVGTLLEVFENARNIDWAAAEALGLIGDKRATMRLISALGEGDGIAQMRAAEALGRIKDERAVIPLVMALKDQFAGEEAALALNDSLLRLDAIPCRKSSAFRASNFPTRYYFASFHRRKCKSEAKPCRKF